jgi:omega-6 fatty acid desaturase (delta-12 desaturase)
MAELTEDKTEWRKLVEPYARADTRRSLWQAAHTVIPYFALFYLAMRSVEISLWLTVPLCVLAAGFQIRSFIIFHDCTHGSFFKSQRGNDLMGIFTGLLTFTAYQNWKHAHAMHHATAGDLDRRGAGDVYTMTLEEYLEARWYVKVGYWLMRWPPTMFLIGAPMMFLLMERLPLAKGRRELASVWWTNLALLIIVPTLGFTFGWRAYLTVQLVTLYLASIAGVWLFYVQHQFQGVYWERHAQWDFFRASLQGSSFYKLPKVLQWFTGSIGFHHIHHLSSKIPNYNLERAYKENPAFHIKPLTILSSLECLKWRVYDEANRRLAGWEALSAARPHPRPLP